MMAEGIGVPNRENKRSAIIELKSGVSIYDCEQWLWFAVMERAILDIGIRESKKTPYKRHRDNSDSYFMQGNSMLEPVLENAGVSTGYLFRVLRKYDVWPLPANYYAI